MIFEKQGQVGRARVSGSAPDGPSSPAIPALLDNEDKPAPAQLRSAEPFPYSLTQHAKLVSDLCPTDLSMAEGVDYFARWSRCASAVALSDPGAASRRSVGHFAVSKSFGNVAWPHMKSWRASTS